MARAAEWSSRVTSIAVGMAIPGLAGYWLDQRWGTEPVLLIGGVILGFASGLWQLMKLAAVAPPKDKQLPRAKPTKPPKDH